MKNLIKLFVIALALLSISCNDSSNRYQLVKEDSSFIHIFDTKEGVLKQYANGKVIIIDFNKDEVRSLPLKINKDVKD